MYVSMQTSQVNQSTSLDPDFSAARHILKFPFLHIFYSADKVYTVWKLMHYSKYVHVHVHSS